jgi:hypothetical protein
MQDALRVASSPHDFKLLVAAGGRTATSMDDLVKADDDRDGPAPSAPAEEAVPVPVAPAAPPSAPSPPAISPRGTVPPPPHRESVPVSGR